MKEQREKENHFFVLGIFSSSIQCNLSSGAQWLCSPNKYISSATSMLLSKQIHISRITNFECLK
jgi:hypothetical protein